MGKVIVGQYDFIEMLLTALLSDGHVLIEGVPGVAKTITAKLLSKTLDTGFSRIQFTPDLMPSDILGTSIFNVKNQEFEFHKGPVFSNFILIDEINRSPAKTQAALFEVMEERQITIDGNTYQMQKPFFVIATQNPIEQEGTYALPEAQLDRFLFKIKVGYPGKEEEVQILKTHNERKGKKPETQVEKVMTGDELIKYRQLVHDIIIDEQIHSIHSRIIHKTRNHSHYLGRFAAGILSATIGIRAKGFGDDSKGRDLGFRCFSLGFSHVLAPGISYRTRELAGFTEDHFF